jgi:hypothetical protein
MGLTAAGRKRPEIFKKIKKSITRNKMLTVLGIFSSAKKNKKIKPLSHTINKAGWCHCIRSVQLINNSTTWIGRMFQLQHAN